MGLTAKSMGFRNLNHKTIELDEALKNYEIFSMANREQMLESLIEFGVLAELIGRIPTIVALKPLTKDELRTVLLESAASPILKQQSIFEKSGYKIIFTDKYIEKLLNVYTLIYMYACTYVFIHTYKCIHTYINM
jgi:ATP-dependent protease Clp ATPase subunit